MNKLPLAQRGQSLPNARGQRLIGIDDGFRVHNGFEACGDFEVELITPISCGMRFGSRICLQPPARSLLRAHTLQNLPRLLQSLGCCEHIFNLVAAGEGASIQKDQATWISGQKICRGFEHQLQAEIILPRRIFDFVGSEDGMPNIVLAQDSARCARGKLPRKRGFAGAGKSRHQKDHGYIRAEASLSYRRFSCH